MKDELMGNQSFKLEEATIKDIQAALQSKTITCKELVLLYFQRIAELDQDGFYLNSILEINPDAIHIAEVLDYELDSIGARGSLYGIPVFLKDNINTGDKMHTSAGSLALADSYAEDDAAIVRKLREAGAIILGKTNMTEFANFMSYNMPNGYSSRGGQVLNPYRPKAFDTGGSSAGSGVAVAANLCCVALGTETSGSIISPASQNSIVGIKPTLGLVSRTGIIPIAHSQDTAGPMARTVEDAAILLGVLTGTDIEDPITFTSKGRSYADYTPFLDLQGLKGARIGLPRDYHCDHLDTETSKILNEAVLLMKELGAVIVDPTNIKTSREFEDIDVLLYEFKGDINAYLATLSPEYPIRTLKDVIAFNNQYAEETLKYGQGILEDAEKTKGTLNEAKYIKAKIKDTLKSQSEGIDAVMSQFELDALLFVGTAGVDIAARAGYPSITVPAGYTSNGEPVGITFTAKAFSEPVLIKLAYSFEQHAKKRIPPKL